MSEIAVIVNSKESRRSYDCLKRVFDLLLAFIALVVLSPVALCIAMGVKLTSRGPLFFHHRRVGKGGKIFYCWKFRSMYIDAEARLDELLASSPVLQEEWERTVKLEKDPRVTPVGRFLRASYLDEIPQLFNVLWGDLAIVGPRPLTEKEHETYYDAVSSFKLLQVRPGLTCLWQATFPRQRDFATRLHLDLSYIEKRSFLLDLRLILKTIPLMIRLKGC